MKSTIELAKEADFHVSGDRVFSPYVGGTSLNSLLENLVALVRAEYEAPLKLAEVALRRVTNDWVAPDDLPFEDGEMPALDGARNALATIRAARKHAHGGVS